MSEHAVTTVPRVASDDRLAQAVGLTFALRVMAKYEDTCPAFALRAVIDALDFALVELCRMHGLDNEGDRA